MNPIAAVITVALCVLAAIYIPFIPFMCLLGVLILMGYGKQSGQ